MTKTELKTLLTKFYENLNVLKEREAKYGGNAPLELYHQIDDHKQAIVLTEQVMAGELNEAGWRRALKPLLVEIEKRSDEAASGVTIGDLEGGIHGAKIAGRDIIEVHVSPQAPAAVTPRLLWLGLVGLLVGAGLIAGVVAFIILMQPSSGPQVSLPELTATPCKMEGSFKVAVVGFAQGTDEAQIGIDMAQEVADKLQQRFDQIEPKPNYTVWGPNKICYPTGSSQMDGDQAKQLAGDLRADVIVYGHIENDKVIPQFEFVTDSIFKDTAEFQQIAGSQALGVPITISGGGDANDRDNVGRGLALNGEILANIFYGLAKYYQAEPDYEKALKYFKAADNIPEWPDDKGKYILYVLLGNASIKVENLQKGDTTEFLASAEIYYRKAISITAYADAYLGLADVYLTRATRDLDRIDPELINQAIAFYQEAKVAPGPASPGLLPRVQYGLGRCYFYQIGAGDLTQRQSALDNFNDVILSYDDGAEPLLKTFAASSLRYLSVIYIKSTPPDLNCALKKCQQALDIPAGLKFEDRAQCEQIKQFLENNDADSQQCHLD